MKLRGTVKFYNSAKGYGFIIPDVGGSDIYFGHQAIIGDAELAPNDDVAFDVSQDRVGRVRASNVEPVG